MDRLVILAPNWLGDAVMALPAIADVRRAAPAATIAVAARPAIAPLFRLVPGVNETIVLERPVSIVNAARWHELGVEIGGKGFDTALLLPNSIHAALLATRAGIPNVWGYRTGWRGALLTRAIRRTSGLHQVEYYQQLVHALGFPNGPIEPRASVPADARAAAKRWPPAYFAELARALSADGVRCLMIGSGADSAAGGEVARAFPTFARGTSERATAGIEPIIDLIGRTDLPALAGVLAHCRTLVTNDSGAMHLAAAVGVGVTAVFGPTDERATRPMGDGHEVLTHSVWCRPCMLRECPIDHRCMRGIGVAAVLGAARRTL